MKNKWYNICVILILLTCFTTGCNKKNTDTDVNSKKEQDDWKYSTAYTVCDAYIPDNCTFGLEIPYVYNGEWENIELVEAIGENITRADIRLAVDKEDELPDVKYDSYKIGGIGLIVSPYEDCEVKITDLIIKVGSEEKKIHFEHELHFTNFATPDSLSGVGALLFTTSMNDNADETNELVFPLSTDENITVTGISSRGNYDFTLENGSFPIQLSAGEGYEFDVIASRKEDAWYSINNFIVEYEDEDGNSGEYVYAFSNTFDYSDDDAVEELIKNILGV